MGFFASPDRRDERVPRLMDYVGQQAITGSPPLLHSPSKATRFFMTQRFRLAMVMPLHASLLPHTQASA